MKSKICPKSGRCRGWRPLSWQISLEGPRGETLRQSSRVWGGNGSLPAPHRKLLPLLAASHIAERENCKPLLIHGRNAAQIN